ncbi:MAG: hypothetical protein KFF73_01830 [Cyclobacteriaceae bacterium]|nr:hypothetical protein [Cyclobacteriaceae bacterium]
MKLKKRALKELGFLIIAALLVIISMLIAGTFFGIWIRDYKLMALTALIFYLVFGFYRMLNSLARKAREGEWDDPENGRFG